MQNKVVLTAQFSNLIRSAAVRWKWTLDKSKVPTLNEEDLEEKFIRGSGPGGQSVNKTSSACFIRHLPSGIIVKSHEFRSLENNRKRARELLIDKLDELYNGEESVQSQMKQRREQKSLKADQKRKKKELMKKEWKEKQI
ncbi:UNVERIFIED_CONTAM: hypothetical protein GTU68_026278 [Idotea baltica]|nr:hypothetical protein [Idotea baltica]